MANLGPITAEKSENAQFLRIGLEVFPVYGDEASGFTVFTGDLAPETPTPFRYQTLDELFFALVNLRLASEGTV
jgi:hypothetical protein